MSPRLSAESAASALSAFTYSPPRRSSPLDDAEADLSDELDLGKAVVTPTLIRLLLVGGLGSLCFGYDSGVISGALVTLHGDLGDLTPFQESWIVSSALLGALIGSLLSSPLTTRQGPKRSLLYAAVLFTLGAIEQSAAMVLKEMILGRIFVGLGVGLAATILPAYLSELAPPSLRGRVVAGTVVLITFGQVLAYAVSALFESLVDHGSWRYMVGLGAVPSLLQILLAFSLPESPSFLLEHEKTAKARSVLKSLNPNAREGAVQREIERILRDQVETEQRALKEGSWQTAKRLLSVSSNRRALVLACGLQFFQATSGFNTVMYYSGKILEQAHFAKPIAFSILIATSNFICTLLSLPLIDHSGRRPLLLYTVSAMVITMFLTGLSFFFIPTPSVESFVPSLETTIKTGPAAYFALTAMVGFCCSFALGSGPIPWVVQGEVFGSELRSLGNGLATATNWTANLIVAATFLPLAHALTPAGAFWVYAVICAFSWTFTYFFLPETKGLSLEACHALFEREHDEIKNGQGRGAYESLDAGSEHGEGMEDEEEEQDGGRGQRERAGVV